MSITSYAQNFEDVMLWRALGHIERGLYIDIGAQDPIIDSVSLAFHEHGWQGIHVEPTAHYAELLRQHRPGETVIQAAVGQESAVLQFFEIPDTGISTADAAIAAQHRERGFNVQVTTVPSIPLAAIFKTCAEQEIHWLKIDVEGFEQQVLSSWGTSAARPWIVVVESTLPLTQIETHQSWESILTGHGYTSAYFDGLNRYYVSDAHPELKAAFASPPNVFDGFALNGTASAPFHQLIAARYQDKIAEAEQEKAALALKHGEQANALRHQYAEREQSLHQRLQALQEQLDRLQQERAVREKLLQEQNSQSRQELENLLRQLVQREQQVAAQLLKAQQQAEQERAELALKHGEQANALQHQHAEREQTLYQKLHALQEQLDRLQQERAVREKLLHEQNTQSRQELENLLRQLVQREQQVAAQLLKAQQQAEQEKAELTRSHSERARALHMHYAEREKALNEQLQTGQQELHRLQQEWALREKEHAEQNSQSRQALESQLRNQVQREQEIAAQLLHIQQQAEQEKTELARRHSEQERALQREHAERQQVLAQQLQAAQETLRNLERDWAQNEKALSKEIAALQHNVQALHHSKQLLTQQHDAELSTKLDEHQRVLAACAALEAELKAEVLLEQQASLQLRQLLAEVQHNLDMVHTSLSWRLTAPFRGIWNSLSGRKSKDFPLKKSPQETSVSVGGNALASPVSLESQVRQRKDEVKVPPHTTAENEIFLSDPPSIKNTTDVFGKLPLTEQMMTSILNVQDLLKMSGERLVRASYATLLGREPDAQGMEHYSKRLQQGYGRVHVLAEIAYSKEARIKAVDLPGLTEILLEYKSMRSWWRRLLKIPSRQERSLNRVEDLLDLLREDAQQMEQRLDARLERLEAAILMVQSSIAHMPEANNSEKTKNELVQPQSFEDQGHQSQLWRKRIQSIQGRK